MVQTAFDFKSNAYSLRLFSRTTHIRVGHAAEYAATHLHKRLCPQSDNSTIQGKSPKEWHQPEHVSKRRRHIDGKRGADPMLPIPY